jgi:hypothetical protein
MEVITKPKIKIEPDFLLESLARTEEEQQVIIHVNLKARDIPASIRIWSGTFLYPGEGSAAVKLLHAERISLAPQWTLVKKRNYQFTLIFPGLPKSCHLFDLVENIPSIDRFEYCAIPRNKTDVYHLTLLY